MAYYILTDNDAITDVYNSDGPFPIPTGAIQITNEDARTMEAHPIGFGVFDYLDGAAVLNADRVASVNLPNNQRAKVNEIKTEALKRIGAIIPALADINQLGLIVEMLQAGMISAPEAGSDMETVKDIYVYGKTKMGQARTATQSQLDSYDPATDTSWPE